MNLLISSDNEYVPWYGIMLTSLFLNNQEEHFDIFLLTAGLTKENTDKLERLVAKYNQSLHIILVDTKILSRCPVRPHDHISIATWFRILAPDLLPETVDKALYLDGDIIINGPVRELYETDMEGIAIAAALDESYNNTERYRQLGLDPSRPYLNAGVLLMNLCLWRKERLVDVCLDCIDKNRERLLFHDQDTLNLALGNKSKIIPIEYNFQFGFIRSYIHDSYDQVMKQEIMKVAAHPVIIHFSGPGKPWFRFNIHPFRSLFLYYKRKSFWANEPLIFTYSFFDLIRDICGRMLRAVHLKPDLFVIPNVSIK
jgi:lipopolysaccharide biosynthesis glycosyltransferase